MNDCGFDARWSELVRRTSLRGQRTDERPVHFILWRLILK
jgi:hypothetical protein